MDAFSSFFQTQSSNGRSWNTDSLKNFRQISPLVQNHLKQVYLTLCCALVASAVGVYLHLLWNIGGLLTLLGCMGSTIWLLSSSPYEERKRVGLLMSASLLEGASIGPLIDVAIEFDQRLYLCCCCLVPYINQDYVNFPLLVSVSCGSFLLILDMYYAVRASILISAFIGTAVAFGCFSAAATLARRREFLYLGGLLSAGLSILMWLHFASSIFGGSTAIFKFELYFGLLVFLGYMVVDTQEIIERAHYGDLDYVKHALTLFTDFVAVFVRILIIMLKNAGEKSDKKKKRRN